MILSALKSVSDTAEDFLTRLIVFENCQMIYRLKMYVNEFQIWSQNAIPSFRIVCFVTMEFKK